MNWIVNATWAFKMLAWVLWHNLVVIFFFFLLLFVYIYAHYCSTWKIGGSEEGRDRERVGYKWKLCQQWYTYPGITQWLCVTPFGHCVRCTVILNVIRYFIHIQYHWHRSHFPKCHPHSMYTLKFCNVVISKNLFLHLYFIHSP